MSLHVVGINHRTAPVDVRERVVFEPSRLPEALREAFREWTPERAAAVCQVPAEVIRGIAEAFAQTDRAVAIWGSGVTSRKGGLAAARMPNVLAEDTWDLYRVLLR